MVPLYLPQRSSWAVSSIKTLSWWIWTCKLNSRQNTWLHFVALWWQFATLFIWLLLCYDVRSALLWRVMITCHHCKVDLYWFIKSTISSSSCNGDRSWINIRGIHIYVKFDIIWHCWVFFLFRWESVKQTSIL